MTFIGWAVDHVTSLDLSQEMDWKGAMGWGTYFVWTGGYMPMAQGDDGTNIYWNITERHEEFPQIKRRDLFASAFTLTEILRELPSGVQVDHYHGRDPGPWTASVFIEGIRYNGYAGSPQDAAGKLWCALQSEGIEYTPLKELPSSTDQYCNEEG